MHVNLPLPQAQRGVSSTESLLTFVGHQQVWFKREGDAVSRKIYLVFNMSS